MLDSGGLSKADATVSDLLRVIVPVYSRAIDIASILPLKFGSTTDGIVVVVSCRGGPPNRTVSSGPGTPCCPLLSSQLFGLDQIRLVGLVGGDHSHQAGEILFSRLSSTRCTVIILEARLD